ncbi:unnamed protein product [Mytilus coruscus]|uniref:FLYWCH-type domain-containing protein n=1 Tax=Mytilus coruscus TaxID=42192 RepID=A0A6J8D9M4_MYTCO|nr:unnamed protein product [Mytilus coruscus]
MAGAMLYVKFLETSREGRHLIWNGYTHRQNIKRDTWISWKCIDRTCRATICTRDDVPSKIGQPHNHLPDQASVNSRKILESVRSRCRSELTPIPSIHNKKKEITKLRDAPWDAQTLETAQKLPTFEKQAANEVKKVQYAAGGKMRGKAKKYREIEERFTTLKETLQKGTTDYIQYGDAASYILKLGN